MYVPKLYQADQQELIALAQAHPFGILISSASELLATHIPLEVIALEERTVLIGHLAKANPQWKTWAEQQEVLAIFNGPHGFVSASWYDHQNISTWNYTAAHFYGKLRLQTAEELRAAVSRLMDRFEQGSAQPVRVSELPEEMVVAHLRGIVGFEIEVTRIEGAKKLSQNRDHHNYQQIVEQLDQKNEPLDKALGKAMRDERPDAFD